MSDCGGTQELKQISSQQMSRYGDFLIVHNLEEIIENDNGFIPPFSIKFITSLNFTTIFISFEAIYLSWEY